MTENIDDLRNAMTRYGVLVPEESRSQLIRYCDLLWSWNDRINLTRHTNMDTFVSRDLLDTQQLSSFVPDGARILDVGSGGGVPGIPLAIIRPELHVDLAESVQKKAKVLESIVRRLGMKSKVHARRAEHVLASDKYDLLTIRAVASLRKLLFWFQKVPRSFEQILLIKGPRWKNEYEEAAEEGLTSKVNLEQLAAYKTPGHDGDSVVLSVRFKNDPIE